MSEDHRSSGTLKCKGHFRGDPIFWSIFIKLSSNVNETIHRGRRSMNLTSGPNLGTTSGYLSHKSFSPILKDPSTPGKSKPNLSSFRHAWCTQRHACADLSLRSHQCLLFVRGRGKIYQRLMPGSWIRWASFGSFETADTSRVARNTASPVEIVAKSAELLSF